MSLLSLIKNNSIFLQLGMQPGGFWRYFHNTGWFLLTRIITLIIAFFTTIYVIRYLGPENYGTLSYAVSFVSLFGFIASFGIDQIILRELISRPDDEGKILGSGIFIKLIGGSIATAAAFISAVIINSSQIELILVAIISLTLFGAAGQIIIHSYQAKVQSKYPSIINVLVSVILAAAKLLVIFFDKGIIFFALILLLESLLYIIFYFVSYQYHFKLLAKWTIDKETVKNLLRTSWPLMLSTLSIAIYYRIDQVMLKHMIGTTAVGIYDAAVRLADVWYIIPIAIIGGLFPAIINAKNTSVEIFRKRLHLCALLLTVLNLAIILPTNLLAPYLVNILFGTEFSGSSGVLTIYIWSLIGFSLAQLINTYLIAENYTVIFLYTSVITVLANIALNIVLIPLYGVNGAAFATLISYSLIPLIPFGFKKIRLQLFASTGKPTL